jgi:hypothetical protein
MSLRYTFCDKLANNAFNARLRPEIGRYPGKYDGFHDFKPR